MILKNVKKAIVPYCLMLLAIIAFTVVSCESEELSPQETQGIKDGLDERKKDRIQICHYDEDLDRYFIMEVNANAWPDHDLHGDVRLDDQDGDGFVPDNECGFGEMGDCDDLDAGINPEAEDILCNGIDENCDGVDAEYALQRWYYFENNDGDDWYVYFPENNFFGTCPPTENHYPFEEVVEFFFDDCDDTDPTIYFGAPETCGDGIDSNCNGRLDDRLVSVDLNGTSLEAAPAYYGPVASVTGEWGRLEEFGCAAPTEDLTGKIVLIDRGGISLEDPCIFFAEKTFRAQELGAIGVIICNQEGSRLLPNGFGAPPDYPNAITIPSVIISYEDCQAIIQGGLSEIGINMDQCEEESSRFRQSEPLGRSTFDPETLEVIQLGLDKQ